MKKRYAAGPNWRPAKGDNRKEGDIIPEANGWVHLPHLVGRLELIEIADGGWEYVAGQKYKGNGEKPGDTVDVSGMTTRLINRLVSVGHLVKVPKAKLEKPKQEAPKPRGRPKGSKNKAKL